MNADTVKVGQVWSDNDKRCAGRRITVEQVVTEVTGVKLANPYAIVLSNAGRRTTISLDRFRPNATGYTLVAESAEVA